MLTTPSATGQADGRPITHRDCLDAGRQMAPGQAAPPRPWVQVRKYHREGAYVLCGQVAELSGNDAEWFKVETCAGPVWAEGRNLRMCSGDGRCTCEPAPCHTGASC